MTMTQVIKTLKNLHVIPTIDTRLSSVVELDAKYNFHVTRKTVLSELHVIPDATIGFRSFTEIRKNWSV